MSFNEWRQWLNRLLRNVKRAPYRRDRFRPGLEALEERWVPTISATGRNLSLIEGASNSVVVATFTDTDPSPVARYNTSISWGDGTTTAGTVTLSGGSFSVSGTHTYADEGTFG